MSVINSNSAAMITANSLNKNDREMNGIMERLSTGKRINSSADDAAGLAIATKMTAQIRGLDQAGRNANNATSMLQLADGAAEQVSNILQRMREITVQASDGSNSTADIAIINVEFVEAAKEIDRIVNVTQFNGKKLLNGDAGAVGNSAVTFQIGANAGETLVVEFSDFNLAEGAANGVFAKEVFTGINDAALTGALASGLTVTDFNSKTMTLSALDVNQYTTVAGLAAFIDAQAETQGLNIDASSDGTNLVFEANSYGPQAASAAMAGGGLTVTTTATAGVAAGPMGANISTFASTGMDAALSTTLGKLDVAIEGVATQRATFGATMNRLTSVVDNLASAAEATSTARGRIEDANYASETTALARSQIISQAGTAMLAQANQKAQSVLSLLQ